MKNEIGVKPLIVVANGDGGSRAGLSRDITNLGYKVRLTDNLSTLLSWVKDKTISLVILDVDLHEPNRNGFDALQEIGRIAPSCPVIALGGQDTVLSSLLAARFGAVDFFARPYSFPALAETISNHLVKTDLPKSAVSRLIAMPLVDKSQSMRETLPIIGKAARSNLPVFIRGQAGTGKFLVANIIHKYGAFKRSSIVTILPSTALAQIQNMDVEAKIEQKNTLVLRRLHGFCKQAQHALCDWLDQNEAHPNPTRIISTCNETEQNPAKPNSILPELHDRLNVLTIKMPSLRQRHDDIAALSAEFLGELSSKSKILSDGGLELLKTWHWPGNVRELKNFLAASAAQTSSPILTEQQLAAFRAIRHNWEPAPLALHSAIEQMLDEEKTELRPRQYGTGLYHLIVSKIERPLIERVLEQVNGNQLAAARKLGINRNTLRKKMVKHGLLNKK